jgi:hypothetical protein
MAVAMMLEWDGVTPEQYEEARSRVGWERDVPEGAIFHAARFAGGKLHVGDVWETHEDFERFAAERLMPVVREMGIESEPQIRIAELYAIFNPAAAHVSA